MEIQNLDIGCGSYRGHNPIFQNTFLHIDIQKTDFNESFLDLICDTHYLPFRVNIFEIVYASHILEHLENPIRALKELIRVSKKLIIIKVPHVLSKVARQPSKLPFDRHLNIFRRKWFQKVLVNYSYTIMVNHKPFLMFFNRPYEIEVVVFK